MFKKSKLLLAMTALMAANQAQAAIPSAEREALITLYNSTNGAKWQNNSGWLGANGTECNWYGVVCDAAESHVFFTATPSGLKVDLKSPIDSEDYTWNGSTGQTATGKDTSMNFTSPGKVDISLTIRNYTTAIRNYTTGVIRHYTSLTITKQLELFELPVTITPEPVIKLTAIDLTVVPTEGTGKTLLEQVNALLSAQIPDVAMKQKADGRVEVGIKEVTYTLIPTKTQKATNGEAEGITITQDGQVKLVTKENQVIYFSAAVAELDAFKKALNIFNLESDSNKHDFGHLKINILTQSGKTAKAAVAESYFSAKPDIASKAATLIDGKIEGVTLHNTPEILLLPAKNVTNFSIAHLVFENANKQLMQQALPPAPADWTSLRTSLEGIGFTQVTLQTDGIILATQNGITYRAIMGYEVKPSAAVDTAVRYQGIADVNADGINDINVTYPNGDVQTLLLLK